MEVVTDTLGIRVPTWHLSHGDSSGTSACATALGARKKAAAYLSQISGSSRSPLGPEDAVDDTVGAGDLYADEAESDGRCPTRVARRGERTGAERTGLERPFVDKKGGVRHWSGGFCGGGGWQAPPFLCRRDSPGAQAAASSNQTEVCSVRSTPQRWATRSTSTSPHPPGSSIPFVRARGANAGPASLT
jgi:hypothetical protein